MTFVFVIILLALVFDYINGFHDAANSIATVVSTKVLTPFQAVLWAAFFNFIAYLIFTDHAVANTIGKTVNKEFITLPVIFAGLIAAIIWNLLTWWYGIPSSSSHTLIGGFAGAAITHAVMSKGWMPLGEIIDSAKVMKTLMFIFLAPLVGMLISIFFTLIFVNPNTWLKSALLALTSVVIWFTFIHFQENKMQENMEKFFKVDKLKKEVLKDPSKQEKLAKAESYAAQAAPFLHDYEKAGAEVTAKRIFETVPMKDAESAKVEEKLKAYFRVDQLKILSDKDPLKVPQYLYASAAVDSLKPIAKQYHDIGHDAMIQAMLQKYPLPEAAHAKFSESLKIDIEKDLAKDLNKSDNKVIRYGMILTMLIFMLSFIYTEKIKEPSAYRTGNMFKKLQLLSSAAFSVGHGGNDAQKVMGIIAAALVANGDILDIKGMPNWVPLACYTAIALGTLSGGWKIVKTMGTRITKVTPLEGVCAETAGASTLFLTEQMGIPVSTTHTITGAIMGVGATKRLNAVRWGVTVNLLWAWILTIPISALLAGLTYAIVSLFL